MNDSDAVAGRRAAQAAITAVVRGDYEEQHAVVEEVARSGNVEMIAGCCHFMLGVIRVCGGDPERLTEVFLDLESD